MRVCLAQVSLLRDALRGRVSPWDLPGLAASHGFDGVEWLDRLLPSFEHRDLARLGGACARAGLGPGGLSLSIQHLASSKRLALQTWRALALLEACPDMGVEFVRVGLGGGGLSLNGLLEGLSTLRPASSQMAAPLGLLGRWAYRVVALANMARNRGHGRTPPPANQSEHNAAQRALRPLAAKASELGLRLGVENHWGLSGRPDDLLKLVYNLEPFNGGICLDLDNFYEDQDSLAGVAALAPTAIHVHYKAHGRDPLEEAFKLDYQAKLELLKDQGYDGAFSIEYEGPEPALEGAIRAAEVLRKIWSALD
ncbi:MAG: sugar phosphate isomerase/epimerase [Desulfarculaceae bacterium]|nr:sugar phosphate isomerase/epimerase [Desulfarculaceae bacterium]MCF8073474.1 sugar phosphate isomerase/epimerase [Desulfarculaceae bacterium]MCF8100379.1 sugar phosphate isomerase/epimerase [Desulfarculaceae bacterium]MCF8115885.1 sugar phosphate isomerase/epimerase [Desulfarculaceae bacterium]